MAMASVYVMSSLWSLGVAPIIALVVRTTITYHGPEKMASGMGFCSFWAFLAPLMAIRFSGTLLGTGHTFADVFLIGIALGILFLLCGLLVIPLERRPTQD
jgi:hypothetical protein